MRILAINGSPRGEHGNTDRILQPFLAGAREAGAETETVYLKDKRIEHCRGCFNCWTKTPGVCIHRDDMPELLDKIRLKDVLVYATPLYLFTVSGLMKDFMDRLIPLLDPYIIERGGQYIHPPRYAQAPKKTVLISNCGFPERHHFGALVETFRLLTSGPDEDLAGVILCAGGELLRVEQLQDSIRWYLDASRKAGREFVQTGHISPATQGTLDRLLADPQVYAHMANAHWDSLIVRGDDPDHPVDTNNGLVPLVPVVPGERRVPQSFREVMIGQASAFNRRTAGELRADIQFRVTGAEPSDFVLRIADGHCNAYEGLTHSPTLTIHTPSEVWLKMVRGELDGQTAYLKGLYTAEGNMELLLRMRELFSSDDVSPKNTGPIE